MTDPTIYEILQNLVTDILMPIILLGLAYYLGTKGINKYQERKDKIVKKEELLREFAKLNSLHNSFLGACYEHHLGDLNLEDFLKFQWSFIQESLFSSSILVGIAKLYYDQNNYDEFYEILKKYVSFEENLSNKDYKISKSQTLELTEELFRIYYKFLDFFKKADIIL